MSENYQRPDRSARKCKYGWFDKWDRLINGALSLVGTPKIELAPGELAMDPHIHTLFSHCSITQPQDAIIRAVKIGLGAVCVMDHNSIKGALDAERCAQDLKARGIIPEDFLVIPGIEINSDRGHIGAMFLREDIPMELTPAEALQAIHDAGGIAVAVHPYHSTGIGDAVFDAPFDAVEVECGSVFGSALVSKNSALTSDPRLENCAKFGSSDAHYIRAIGACYTILTLDEPTLEGVRNAIIERKSRAVSTQPYLKMRKLLGGVRKLR
ncbi:MAG: PHP domain-containing protein [Armatimonadetes bacterium]|nr:PHP domain-containing protein [Armatimonadota bacterium]